MEELFLGWTNADGVVRGCFMYVFPILFWLFTQVRNLLFACVGVCDFPIHSFSSAQWESKECSASDCPKKRVRKREWERSTRSLIGQIIKHVSSLVNTHTDTKGWYLKIWLDNENYREFFLKGKHFHSHTGRIFTKTFNEICPRIAKNIYLSSI